uniref:DUF1326 domain-containing protein n=1 Tax=Bursaphelenchus xylophilus TaxID=6326 RepID=A0A1I7RYK3_BURXY
MIVLNTPEIVLFDADCPRSYGKCPVYCEVPQFCRSFCNPLCCGTVAACGKVKGYDHNSTMFKLRGKQFWHAPQTDAVGVWAEDEVHVLPVPQPGKDGSVNAKKTAPMLVVAIGPMSQLAGLGHTVNTSGVHE